ncbi:MAG: dockerin type I repeat-containing protein [Clostridia bacterium]|nr:dockerin type I repeat-containing protein [Clostridia bacterium]
MKKLVCLILTVAMLAASLSVSTLAAEEPSFNRGKIIDLSRSGVSAGDNSTHGNHQTRTVHTSHGDYCAYITGTYTDSENQTVNKWSLIRVDPATGDATVVFTGEKYYDSSQVSLIVDKDENVWAITSTSDSGRNLTAEGIDSRAHRLDAKTGEVTSYSSIIGGGAKDGYGYATCFYDKYKDRIVVMHAGGDYKAGSTSGASLNWTIFDMKTNTWQTRVRYVKIEARHCYMYGYLDENGGMLLMAQRDIKAASLGYPEIGSDDGLTYADKQYIQQNNIVRWAANYCWDQLDLYYFPNITQSKCVSYSVCAADYSRVTGTQSERYTLAKRLSNYYPAIQNNNGGDFMVTETDDGRRLLHITYNKAYIQAAMNRSIGQESIWYYQVWDVTDGSAAVKLFDGPIYVDGVISDDNVLGGGSSFRLYEDTLGNVYFISGHKGCLNVFRVEYNGKGGYNYVRVGSSVSLSFSGNLLNISSSRGGSITDNKVNVLYYSNGKYMFTQMALSPVEYEPVPCSHNYVLSDSLSTFPTCTEGGSEHYICTYCNGTKTEAVSALGHDTRLTHVEPTCTEDGYSRTDCTVCDYSETVTVSATGHSFEGGACIVCLEPDPDFEPSYSLGDINGDGQINAMDANILKRFISGTVTPGAAQLEAGDIDKSGQVNGIDSNIIMRFVSGSVSGLEKQ